MNDSEDPDLEDSNRFIEMLRYFGFTFLLNVTSSDETRPIT
jgi:hypothetical protein